ncbi:APOL3 isoform 17, partial [Pan troglodytes]
YADARLEVGSTQLRTAGSRSHSFKGSFLAWWYVPLGTTTWEVEAEASLAARTYRQKQGGQRVSSTAPVNSPRQTLGHRVQDTDLE